MDSITDLILKPFTWNYFFKRNDPYALPEGFEVVKDKVLERNSEDDIYLDDVVKYDTNKGDDLILKVPRTLHIRVQECVTHPDMNTINGIYGKRIVFLSLVALTYRHLMDNSFYYAGRPLFHWVFYESAFRRWFAVLTFVYVTNRIYINRYSHLSI